jgi:outer membrane protein
MEDPLLDEPIIIIHLMKNFRIVLSFVLFLLFGLSNAQKVGVVDTE